MINNAIFEKCKLILIESKDFSIITKGYKSLFLGDNNYVNKTYQHLYVLSDEKIETNDWCLDSTNQIRKCVGIEDNRLLLSGINFLSIHPQSCKKIIASTDDSLNILCDSCDGGYKKMHKLSNEFLEKYIDAYNNEQQLDTIYVEYDNDSKKLLINDGCICIKDDNEQRNILRKAFNAGYKYCDETRISDETYNPLTGNQKPNKGIDFDSWYESNVLKKATI